MVYVCAELHNFSALRGRDPRPGGGGGWNPPPPPPPGCEMGSKDPASLGLMETCTVMLRIMSKLQITLMPTIFESNKHYIKCGLDLNHDFVEWHVRFQFVLLLRLIFHSVFQITVIYRQRYEAIFIDLRILGFRIGSLVVDAELQFNNDIIETPTPEEAEQTFNESLTNSTTIDRVTFDPATLNGHR